MCVCVRVQEGVRAGGCACRRVCVEEGRYVRPCPGQGVNSQGEGRPLVTATPPLSPASTRLQADPTPPTHTPSHRDAQRGGEVHGGEEVAVAHQLRDLAARALLQRCVATCRVEQLVGGVGEVGWGGVPSCSAALRPAGEGRGGGQQWWWVDRVVVSGWMGKASTHESGWPEQDRETGRPRPASAAAGRGCASTHGWPGRKAWLSTRGQGG